MHVLLIGLAVLAAVGGYFWYRRRPRRWPQGQSDAYQKLLRKTLGDRAQAERLIEFERKRNPQAPRLALVHAALERWERDLR